MQWDTLAFLPPRPFASVRFDPLAWSSGSDQRRISGCGIRWLLAGPDSLPLWLCRVCAFVLLRCFSCSHTVLPKEHSLGFFFSPPFPHVNAVFFFNSTCIWLLIILVWLCMWRIIKNLEPWNNVTFAGHKVIIVRKKMPLWEIKTELWIISPVS